MSCGELDMRRDLVLTWPKFLSLRTYRNSQRTEGCRVGQCFLEAAPIYEASSPCEFSPAWSGLVGSPTRPPQMLWDATRPALASEEQGRRRSAT